MALLSNIPVTNLLSLSFVPIEAFNEQAEIVFGLMLETKRETSRERIFLRQRQQIIGWLMELLPQRGVSEKTPKRRLWTWTNFDLVNRVLYRKSAKEPEIWDAIICIHNSLNNEG